MSYAHMSQCVTWSSCSSLHNLSNSFCEDLYHPCPLGPIVVNPGTKWISNIVSWHLFWTYFSQTHSDASDNDDLKLVGEDQVCFYFMILPIFLNASSISRHRLSASLSVSQSATIFLQIFKIVYISDINFFTLIQYRVIKNLCAPSRSEYMRALLKLTISPSSTFNSKWGCQI